MIAARGIAALGAIVGLVGLVLQFWLIWRGSGGVLEAAWSFFAYFTILTNSFVTLVFARAALRGGDGGLNAPRVELMAATSILFVCAVYNLLLASRWDPQGWQMVADAIVHQIAPVLFALYWLARPHGRLVWKDAAFAALWPAGYSVYGLTRGAIDGFYPYFFMDPSVMAWPQVLLNMTALVAAFLAGAILMIALDGVLARRTRKSA